METARAGSGRNLALILSAWMDMLRSGGMDELSSLLDENVMWQGVLPDQVCRNRVEVLDALVHNPARPPRLTRIEAQEIGEGVAVSVEGPDFEETDTHAVGAPRSLLFTFRDGRVVRIDSFATRDAAFEPAAR
ncbi:MAG: hypothetical protein ACREPA_03995 [Candidatus Dormibacteraceae bacterium]